jgi:hypothetical protein
VWTSVQSDLAALLGSRVYPALAEDEGYRHFFRNAGFSTIPSSITGMPPALQLRVADAARMCAQLVTLQVDSSGGLRERRAKAVLIEGPTAIYRLWSGKDNNRVGAWWFTGAVLQQALKAEKNNRKAALEWLRDKLAVSLDWNDCDRVAQIRLGPGVAIPAIEGWGLPMRQFSRQAPGKPNVRMADYWRRYRLTFQGQKTQYFLPFVPANRVQDYW